MPGIARVTRDGTLDPASTWRPTRLRDVGSGTTAASQWAVVRDRPFVTV